MGTYYEFLFRGVLKKDAPTDIQSILTCLEVNEYNKKLKDYPNLDVDWLHTSSYYIHPQSIFLVGFDPVNELMSFFIYCSVKEGHKEEIHPFVNTLVPHLQSYGGFIRNEEGEVEWL